ATGIDPGLVMDGRSLIPVAQQPGIERGRELLVEQPSFKAIRTERYMYVEHQTGERELYDLQSDPFELASLQNDPAYQAVKAQLAEQLGALKTCAGPSCLRHSPPSSTLSLDFSPSDLSTTAFKSGRAILHAQTSYVNPGNGNPGGATSRARLYFDDDFKFNPSAIPICDPASLQPDQTMADAMSRCGPARIGDGTAQVSVDGASANGCALSFNGRSGGDPTVVLFMRFKVANPSTIRCTSPASNRRGDTSVVLAAPLKSNNSYGGADLVGGKLLDINNITTASAYPLSDLDISIQNGSYVQARCHDGDHRLDLEIRVTDNQNTTQAVQARKACT
ncbi:MAG: sulfatase/phosphatase domain-containing protein, partial [Solirubrobacterales bacterium]